DAALLPPGPDRLTELTGMAHAGTRPVLPPQLPDEEGATLRGTPPAGAPTVAGVRYPYASNLDELHLRGHPARARRAVGPADLVGADPVGLPGPTHVAADGAWLRAQGVDGAVAARVAGGGLVLGVCGGCMLLGEAVEGGAGVEGAA